jgi:hypothetical protein
MSVEMLILFPHKFFLCDDELKLQLDQKIDEHYRGQTRPNLERAWNESVYNAQTGCFEPAHFCLVTDQAEARMLLNLQLCLQMKTKTGASGFSATFTASTHPPSVREQWRRLGNHLQTLQKIDQDFAQIGAIQDSGMFALPGHYMSFEDYGSKVLPKIQEAADSMTGRELLRPEVRCLFKFKPVDLEKLQEQVARLNTMRIRAVVEIRKLQHATRLDVTIPGFS